MEVTSTSTSTSRKSFGDYLHDVAGESHDLDDEDEEELRRLKVIPSEGNKSTQSLTSQQRPRETPLSGMTSPQLTEARSFVNGLLSPFSPLLEQKQERDEYLEFLSLQPCRKVSVVVRVLPCEEHLQRCLFPHVKATNPLMRVPNSPHDMVVVKPSAFGKVIPSSVTMETARLVAQVAHISSEDWARLYEFHHVMWPFSAEGKGGEDPDQFRTMDSLSRAVAQDALGEGQSSLLISMGQAPTCVGDGYDKQNCQLSKIIALCRRLMEPKSAVTVSIVEIREGKNSFIDLVNPSNKQVYLRHVDMKGAVLEGLSQVSIDEIHDHWPTTQASTVIATINIWDDSASHDTNKEPDSRITCVELSQSTESYSRAQYRSCTVSLGLALRQLLRQSTRGTDPVIAFRESAITKVLQRSLEGSKIVLLASVSQLSQDYETTLTTLNFLRGLLVRQGKTASSPFTMQPTENDGQIEETTTMTDKLQEYVTDETILQQITADPRQRLAKIMKTSPPQKLPMDIETVPSPEEDYNPVDYMQGLDSEEHSWYSPGQASRKGTRESSSPIYPELEQYRIAEETAQITTSEWSMEEPDEFPMEYPSASDSSSDKSPQSQSSEARAQAFDYGDDDALADHQDLDTFSLEGLLPAEEGFLAHPNHNEFDRTDDHYFHSDGLQLPVDHGRKGEEISGGSVKTNEGVNFPVRLSDNRNHASNDRLVPVHDHGQFDTEGHEDLSEATGKSSSSDCDVSHEIVFTSEDEEDNGSVYEQPIIWSDSRKFEEDQDYWHQPSATPSLMPVAKAYEQATYEQNTDESFISGKSHHTFPFLDGKLSMDDPKVPEPESLRRVRSDSQYRHRSAFESVSPLGGINSSLHDLEEPYRDNSTVYQHTVTDRTEVETRVQEKAVDYNQDIQQALWRSR